MNRFIQNIILTLLIFLLCFSQTMEAKEIYHWNFKPASNNKPADTEPYYKQILEKHDGFFIGDTDEKVLYLTFDNGYENGYTEEMLDILKEKKVPATFFVTGHYLRSAPDLVKRMADEGHIVGNHSWNHPSLPALSDEKITKELNSVKKEYQRITGDKNMNYLRPPQGTFNENSIKKARELGYLHVFWSFAYVDWETNSQKGKQYAYDSIMKRIHPGAVMLLHTVSSDNSAALGEVIDECRKQGYRFGSIDEIASEKALENITP
ncbi:delta-lactam-biosynthetic de-N-acetylase [Alteribacillus sp. HJP-4]|uniref:delta-lactam-biosynthetic de-N-acetylase n=1 Tax=Alteribacillus sp. HJP-4 TaxID=2775394 RepID=UPI0035CCE39D